MILFYMSRIFSFLFLPGSLYSHCQCPDVGRQISPKLHSTGQCGWGLALHAETVTAKDPCDVAVNTSNAPTKADIFFLNK
uniref:Secreted protein n=1 Tax=Anguilla anguilla TaxID=7936 RepID=A0A0E9UHT5_ANGAN